MSKASSSSRGVSASEEEGLCEGGGGQEKEIRFRMAEKGGRGGSQKCPQRDSLSLPFNFSLTPHSVGSDFLMPLSALES